MPGETFPKNDQEINPWQQHHCPIKNPGRGRGFLLDNVSTRQSGSAGASAPAGTTATSPATATKRLGRGNPEAGTGPGLDEIYLDDPALIAEVIVQQEFNPAMIKRRIIFFWLIQSQSQRGACSATLHQRNTYRRRDIIIGQVRFQFDDRLLCYLKHP
ncbi:MAG: hypothetical protein A2512_01650 [Deltaproteobacteria bacterium RIFOXYD12_FULL_56_24]|nr:MAG: hypothetical protein A2512_01650 [Deltaproteobacteria bacterium RIFOXYD12_FULL_56_24]